MDCDPEVVYGVKSATNIEDVILEGKAFAEVPLGQGDVNWDAYLAALNDIGYQGFLTIEREVGADPAGDIKIAADFLRARI